MDDEGEQYHGGLRQQDCEESCNGIGSVCRWGGGECVKVGGGWSIVDLGYMHWGNKYQVV